MINHHQPLALRQKAQTAPNHGQPMSLADSGTSTATDMARKGKRQVTSNNATRSMKASCPAFWKISGLQGCGCQHCKEHFYHERALEDHRQPFHPLRGLTPGRNEAWHIAEIAVAWIIATSEHIPARAASVAKWTQWDSRYPCKDVGKPFKPRVHDSVGDEALAEVVDIFNELFFAGQLPSSRIRIYWRSLGMYQLGYSQPGSVAECMSRIFVNKDYSVRPLTKRLVVAVVLHEMIHAYLGQYTCYPWSKAACANGVCGSLYMANMGISGHGRAFHHIAKTIEMRMRSILGFTELLGRCDGMAMELCEGGPRPCVRDAKRLYGWMLRLPDFWRCRDDDNVLKARTATRQRSRLWMPMDSLHRSKRRYSF